MFKVRTLILAFLALAVGIAVSLPALADEPQQKPSEGVIKAIDATAQTITLEDGKVLKVDEKTEIKRENKPAKFADLQVGDTVKYHIEKDHLVYVHAMKKK